jgi:VWFA-related protein
MMLRQWGVPIVATLMWLHGASRPAPDQQTFRASVKAVPIYVSVIDDSGHLVTDLTRDDFQILDNGRPVEIAVFDNHVQRITGVLLLQALSSQFQREREAASAFVHVLASEDRICIGSLGSEVAISPILSGDKPTLSRILDEEFWPGGGSPLWRGIDSAMRALSSEQAGV